MTPRELANEHSRKHNARTTGEDSDAPKKIRELQERIKRLEEELMDTKNNHAVLVADVVLNEDRAEQIKRLRKANFQLREGAEEQKQRIKRLEELGDWMRHHSNNDWWCEKWDEAKEAKP